MSGLAAGAAAGCATAGALLVVRSARSGRTLAERVEPFLSAAPAVPGPRRLVPGSATEVVRALGRRLDRAVGGGASVRRRLRLVGGGDVAEFRGQQMVAALAALVCGVALAWLRSPGGVPSAPAGLAALAGAVAAGQCLDWRLSRRAARARASALADLPTLADLVALAVAAGESVVPALDRAGALTGGLLGCEFRSAVVAHRGGTPVAAALEAVAERLDVAAVHRFVDGLVVAVERGTPLAEVLRGQALDVREAARRALIERAGRQEIWMLVPVVFLILPVSVVFALFPGVYGLSIGGL